MLSVCFSLWVLLITLASPFHASTSCGYFLELSSGDTEHIYSPSYPQPSPTMTRCYWTFKVPQNYTPIVTIVDYAGSINTVKQYCGDFLLIQETNSSGNVVYNNCLNSSGEVRVNARAVRIGFETDHLNEDSRLSAIISMESTTDVVEYYTVVCNLTQFTCPNAECIETSYLCDNYSDCGCDDDSCDEGVTICGLVTRETMLDYVVPSLVGFGVFVGIFIISAILEAKELDSCRKKLHRGCTCCEKKVTPEDSGGHHIKQAMQRMLAHGGAAAGGSSQQTGSENTSPQNLSRRSSQYLSPRPSLVPTSDPILPFQNSPSSVLTEVEPKYGNSLKPPDYLKLKPV